MMITPDEIENVRLEIEREHLAIEKARSQADLRFTHRHFGTIITAAISLVAVVVSVSQVWSAYVTKDKEIALAQAQKDKELAVLQSQKDREYQELIAQNNREWNLSIAKFVSEHADLIFGGDQLQRQHIQDVMLVTFPPNITSIIFRRLERVSSSPQVQTQWREARRSLPTVVRDIPVLHSTTLPNSSNVIVDLPARDGAVTSPLRVSGKAPSSWFFEGEFSIELLDENRKVLATGIARADFDATVRDGLVPFSAQVTFNSVKAKKGYLVLEVDSPKDGSVIQLYQMPINFVETK